MTPNQLHFSTSAVHAGELKRKPFGAITTPIVPSSTYTFRDSAEILEFMQTKARTGVSPRDEYGRYSNPTQSVAEAKLAALERGSLADDSVRALLFGSGMSAITTVLLTLFRVAAMSSWCETAITTRICTSVSAALGD
jgi:cystathionine gamma-synthase